jgi:hypothetical protein
VEAGAVIPSDLIRQATAAGIDLYVQGGRLILESPFGPPPSDLLSTIKAHKQGVVACLDEYAGNATIRTGYADRVAHLLELSALERQEAESLAEELAASGGLGQFVVCLCTGWHALDDRDRRAAVIAWEMAADHIAELERAA